MSDAPARWWPAAVLDRGRWGALVEPVLGRVAAARDRGRFPHALLLTGSPGLGREAAAVETAVMLVCHGATDPWSVSPCAERIRAGIHPDVVAIIPEGAKGIIKVDLLRDAVVNVVGARPYEGLRRVWIFDGVEEEHFPAASANAFLKTLEEPPEHALFLLLAANPTAVLPTIRSRCQQLAVPPPTVAEGDAGGARIPPELSAAVLSGVKLAPVLAFVRAALAAAAAGESRLLLRMPYVIEDNVSSFEAVAAVAAEMATEIEHDDAAEGLARLAADLLATERRCRALNLGADRQLVSCLLRWYQDRWGEG